MISSANMAWAIFPSRRGELISLITDRQSYIEANDEVVNTAYEILLSVVQMKTKTGEEYAAELASCFPPEFLFDEEIVQSEGQRSTTT